jgi:hypothetical protein
LKRSSLYIDRSSFGKQRETLSDGDVFLVGDRAAAEHVQVFDLFW